MKDGQSFLVGTHDPSGHEIRLFMHMFGCLHCISLNAHV